MKKFLLIAFVSIFSLVSLWAVGNESMTLNAIVPEDFGVEFPPEAVRLDRFVFEIDSENEQHQLLDSWVFPIGIVEDNFGYREITLLYYGNSSKAYDVMRQKNIANPESGYTQTTGTVVSVYESTGTYVLRLTTADGVAGFVLTDATPVYNNASSDVGPTGMGLGDTVTVYSNGASVARALASP